MASKFGFAKMAAAHDAIMLQAMTRLAKETRDHFVRNFDKQAWGRVPWAPLLSRSEPPDKLNVTGELKNKTQNSIKFISATKVLMENDATDSRGRRYSNYHNEGTSEMVARPIMKQDDELTRLQLKILREETGKIWQRV